MDVITRAVKLYELTSDNCVIKVSTLDERFNITQQTTLVILALDMVRKFIGKYVTVLVIHGATYEFTGQFKVDIHVESSGDRINSERILSLECTVTAYDQALEPPDVILIIWIEQALDFRVHTLLLLDVHFLSC